MFPGKKFGFTCLHLEAQHRENVDELQTTHIRSLLNFLQERKVPHLICGDFNNFPESLPLQTLQVGGYTRIENPIPTFRFFNRNDSIDHLFVYKFAVNSLDGLIPDSTEIPSETHPSDHLPIRFRVEIKEV